MDYNILYKESVKKDLRGIDKSGLRKIFTSIESVLMTKPKTGKRLTGEFEGLYSIRAGDYRIVYSILKESVLILRIGHRKDVYRTK